MTKQVDVPVHTQPETYQLSLSVSPNPFNTAIAIEFQLPIAGHVSTRIFSVDGCIVEYLTDDWMNAGSHKITWNGECSPTGIYICRIKTDQRSAATKLVLVR